VIRGSSRSVQNIAKALRDLVYEELAYSMTGTKSNGYSWGVIASLHRSGQLSCWTRGSLHQEHRVVANRRNEVNEKWARLSRNRMWTCGIQPRNATQELPDLSREVSSMPTLDRVSCKRSGFFVRLD
jgi:hypothetical protein